MNMLMTGDAPIAALFNKLVFRIVISDVSISREALPSNGKSGRVD